ncbi:hypothetical protein AAHH79_40260, partial [Burkholderia pseudomallei]
DNEIERTLKKANYSNAQKQKKLHPNAASRYNNQNNTANNHPNNCTNTSNLTDTTKPPKFYNSPNISTTRPITIKRT